MKSRRVIVLFLLLNATSHLSQGQNTNQLKQSVLEKVRQSDALLFDNPLRSLELSSAANKLARELSDDSLIAITYNRIGNAHWSLGNVIDALEHIQFSLQLAESNQLESVMAKNYGSLGNVYSSAGLVMDAIGYYRLELAIQETLDEPYQVFVTNNNIGKAFLDIDLSDSAQFYLDNAIAIISDDFQQLHSILYFNLAEKYFKDGKLAMTDSLLQLTFENARQYDSKRGLIQANQLRAELDRKNGDFSNALRHALIATDLAKESKSKELIYITNKTLSNCYADLKDFEKAYFYNGIHDLYLDSIQNVSTVNELELLNYYQRLFRMRVLEQRNEFNKELADQRQFIIYSLITVLVIAVFMLSIIVRRGRKIRKQAIKLERLNSFKNKIFAIVSHDLKSPIQSVASAIEMFHERLISKEEIETHLPEIQDKTSRLLDLLNNIFQWAEGQINGEMLKKEEFELLNVFTDLKEELSDRLTEKEINLIYDGDMILKLFSNVGIVRIVLRNLIVNAIKFSFPKSTVTVNAFDKGVETIIEVVDHGVGIKPALLGGIFSMEAGSSLGTQGEAGNGLGLALCFDLVRGLGGKIEAESERGRGSVFRVYLKDQNVPQ